MEIRISIKRWLWMFKICVTTSIEAWTLKTHRQKERRFFCHFLSSARQPISVFSVTLTLPYLDKSHYFYNNCSISPCVSFSDGFFKVICLFVCMSNNCAITISWMQLYLHNHSFWPVLQFLHKRPILTAEAENILKDFSKSIYILLNLRCPFFSPVCVCVSYPFWKQLTFSFTFFIEVVSSFWSFLVFFSVFFFMWGGEE